MKIGVDLDNVLSQSMPALIEFHNKNYGTNQKLEDFKTANFEEAWGGSLEQAIQKIDKFHKTYGFKNLKPIEGAKEVLEKLKKNNELYIITARTDDIKKDTEDWIELYFPNIFSKIYFTNQFSMGNKSIPKKKVCDDLGIDVFIEDNITNVLECTSPNRKVYLFDYPWNQTNKLPEGVERVHSWKEIDIK